VPEMIKAAESGLKDDSITYDEEILKKAKQGLEILRKWDFRHNFDSQGAPIMEAWEF